MLKRILITAVILVLVGTVGYAKDQITDIPIGDSPSMGPADAPVTIIEFIDFQ